MKFFLKKSLLICLLAISFIGNEIYAEEEIIQEPISINIHLEVINQNNHLYDNDISVVACDSDNNIETEDTITPYCAILQSGLSSDWNWDWAPGAFINSLEGIAGYTTKDKEDKDVYHYWSWSLNGNYGETGLNQYTLLQNNDLITLEFIDPIEEIIVAEEEEVPTSNRSNGSRSKKIFDTEKAINFLIDNQKEDGSFGNDLYTDWVAIGISKSGGSSDELIFKLKNYYNNKKFELNNLTDIERRTMALMALGINPYDEVGINYIKKIIEFFDGEQMGDVAIYNDDIFALIALSHAGYTNEDEMISKIISFIISKQRADGSWENVDMTSASIQALHNFKNLKDVEESISKAEGYLIKTQKEDSSFGNSFSTSWAIQAFSTNENFEKEIENGIDYLAEKQEKDGGLDGQDLESRIWVTSYALPAVLKLSWSDILDSFEKPKENKKSNLEMKKFKENKISENKVKVKLLEEKSADNLLLASALNSDYIKTNERNNTEFLSQVSQVVSRIKMPFVWLYSHIHIFIISLFNR